MAAAEWGEHSVRMVQDGSPEAEPPPMSSLLERALLCERLGWQILPDELEGRGLELSQALAELHAFRAGQQYARDLEKLTPEQAEIMSWVERVRNLPPAPP